MQKGGKDSPDCTLSNIQSLSLQGQTRLHLPLLSLNLRPQQSRLEIRRHFFSQRVVEEWSGVEWSGVEWSGIPADLKQAVNVKSFKNGYRTHREKMVERT